MTRYSRLSADAQFGHVGSLSHDYVRDNEKSPGSNYLRSLIDYVAHDDDGNSLAYAQVKQSPGYTDARMTDHVKKFDVVDAEHTDVRPTQADHSRTKTYPAVPGQQLVMFGVDHKPTRRQVTSLYARDSTAGKMATMNILAMADNASTEATGHGLKPDGNLSKYSLGLVMKLYEKGAISGRDMPDDWTPSNDLDFDDATDTLDSQHTSKVDDGQLINLNHRLPHAKARIRQIMGRSAPSLNTEPKNEQLKFEGFE